ncbi:hypothetical protein ES288_A01G263400v1 [Gossypium darwinii]|uniref:HIT domain-containing protein n=2 Tax=Gossypium TaxID=3633 RepID=A0A5D2RY87_GOSTO|nr:hypothetical protein ES288_A01G263400v1 [Gossypium darwinii]TYI44940.1 hypothetical protein ES332_A01G272700v1 [Gossypium tomentosum]
MDIAPQAPTHILIIPKSKDGLTGLSKIHIAMQTKNERFNQSEFRVW